MKTSVLDGPSDQIQKFFKPYYCYDIKNLAEIMHFNINASLKFPLQKFAEKTRFRAIFKKILKSVVSLSKVSRSQIFVKMWEVKRTFDIRHEKGWFLIRSLAKVVRKLTK